MTGINHVLTGAAIATVVRQPLIALPLAFISHFILDVMPHFGIPSKTVFARNERPLYKAVLAIDVALTLVALVAVPLFLRPVINPWIVLLVMVAAMSPDTAWVYRFVKEVLAKVEIPKMTWFSRFHLHIQWGERIWGLFIEIPYLLAVGTAVWAARY